MSITETTRRAGPYATDGSQVEFPFAFKVFKAEDVVVTRSENGLDTDLTLTTDYTVNLNPNQDAAPGGEVVLTSAPNGPTITITSGMAATQPTVFTNAGGFFPRVLNDSLDRVTILVQQLMERVSRVPLLPLGDAPVGQFPVVLPNGKFGWSTGSGTDSGLRADLGTDAPGKGADIVVGVATTAALAATDGGAMVHWRQSTTGEQLDENNSITLAGVKSGDDISAALSVAIVAANGKQIRIPGGRWYLDAPVIGSTSVNLVLDDGAEIIKRHDDGRALSLTSPFLNIVSVTGPVSKGALSFVVADASGYSVGDDIRLVSADRLPGTRDAPGDGKDYRKGEALKIASVVGNTIFVRAPVRDNYTTSVRVGRYSPSFVSIRGGSWGAEDGHDADLWKTGLIRISGYPEVNIDTTVNGSYGQAIAVHGAVRGSLYAAGDNLRDSQPNGQFGYLFDVVGISGMTVHVVAGNCRHGITTNQIEVTATEGNLALFGPTGRGCKFSASGAGASQSLIDTHHGAEDILIDLSNVSGRSSAGSAISIRGRNITAIAPKGLGSRYGLYVFTETGRVTDVATDGTRGIRIVQPDMRDCQLEALFVNHAECEIVGGYLSSSVWSTIKVEGGANSRLTITDDVKVVPGAAESGADIAIEVSSGSRIDGTGRFVIDAENADDTLMTTGSVFRLAGVTMDGVDVTYYSPKNKPTNLFSIGTGSPADVRNCDVQVRRTAAVNLGYNIGYNSAVRNIETSGVGYPSSASDLTVTDWSAPLQIWTNPLNANRNVTLPSGTSHADGQSFKFVITPGAVDVGKLVFSNGAELDADAARSLTVTWSRAQEAWLVTGREAL